MFDMTDNITTHAVDIWSAGVLLYYAGTGIHPFNPYKVSSGKLVEMFGTDDYYIYYDDRKHIIEHNILNAKINDWHECFLNEDMKYVIYMMISLVPSERKLNNY